MRGLRIFLEGLFVNVLAALLVYVLRDHILVGLICALVVIGIGIMVIIDLDRRRQATSDRVEVEDVSVLKVSGEPDPTFSSPRYRASHRVDGDQVVLLLENTHHLDLPAVRCRIVAFGDKNTTYDCDVTNPFKETKETRVGPAKLECRFPQDFTGMRYAAPVDVVLRPGVNHFVWWFDSFDENLSSPLVAIGFDGNDHRLAVYQFRTVL